MHEQFANAFYSSSAWRRCRAEYRRMRGGLCERCLRRGLIVAGDEVHHRVALTPQNLQDASVTLNFDNLELLCRACHDEAHCATVWRCDDNGHVTL